IKPTRYDKLVRMIAGINHEICDAKVSIDLKRILRLPSTLHYKVSMKCTAINDIESFDPFDDAVPKFVDEK
ncbi:MAG: DNA primase, partial [Methanosphaera sp. rholeuAM270]